MPIYSQVSIGEKETAGRGNRVILASVSQSANTADSKCRICTLNCTLEELAILNYLRENPYATQKELAEHIHRSERTVKSITVKLQKDDCLKRKNGRRDGFWVVKTDCQKD